MNNDGDTWLSSGWVPNIQVAGEIMSKVLSSWKEIALYLGKRVRTVQRWERTEGLPVHRPKPSLVLAHTAELDRWIRNHPGDASTGIPETLVSDLRRIRMLILNEHPLATELRTVLERAGCEVVALQSGQPVDASADASRADVILAMSFATAKRSTPNATSDSARAALSSDSADSPSQFS